MPLELVVHKPHRPGAVQLGPSLTHKPLELVVAERGLYISVGNLQRPEEGRGYHEGHGQGALPVGFVAVLHYGPNVSEEACRDASRDGILGERTMRSIP